MKNNSSLTTLVTSRVRWHLLSVPRAARSIISIVIVGVSMSACGAGSEEWKEEVKLSDGRTIVVERETVSERGGDEWVSNRSGTKPQEYRIRFADPTDKGKMIEWRSTKKSPKTWPEIPLVLDVESGQPTIFSLVAISNGCEVYSRYVYRDGGWVEEALPEQFAMRSTNLFLRIGVDMPKFIDLETKNRINTGIEGRGYRRALTQVGPIRKVCG